MTNVKPIESEKYCVSPSVTSHLCVLHLLGCPSTADAHFDKKPGVVLCLHSFIFANIYTGYVIDMYKTKYVVIRQKIVNFCHVCKSNATWLDPSPGRMQIGLVFLAN